MPWPMRIPAGFASLYSRAKVSMTSTGTPDNSLARSKGYSAARSFRCTKAGFTATPSASKEPSMGASTPSVSAGTALPDAGSHTM